jgi:hypothetical protein
MGGNWWIWRCGECGQEELVKVGEDPEPCFRCYLSSPEYAQEKAALSARLPADLWEHKG